MAVQPGRRCTRTRFLVVNGPALDSMSQPRMAFNSILSTPSANLWLIPTLAWFAAKMEVIAGRAQPPECRKSGATPLTGSHSIPKCAAGCGALTAAPMICPDQRCGGTRTRRTTKAEFVSAQMEVRLGEDRIPECKKRLPRTFCSPLAARLMREFCMLPALDAAFTRASTAAKAGR